MPCKQIASYKIKFNQCYPINPSIQNFYNIIRGLFLHCSSALNKSQKHRLGVIRNRCLCHARRTIDCNCISNNELRSRCNTANLEQRILALANNFWRKASDNNDGIVNFTYHQKQILTQKRL